MGKIKRIFLDVDGVLANWTKMACERTDVEYPKDFQFPNQMWLDSKIGQKRIINASDDFSFWMDLEKYPWSDEIVKMVAQSGKHWNFLTKPMKTRHCFAGKAEWMFEHYPRYWDKMWIITGSKATVCRGPGDLLIDDLDKNLNEWTDAGGTTFEWKEVTDDWSGNWKERLAKLKEVIYAE